jgi:extracellular matrix protein 14
MKYYGDYLLGNNGIEWFPEAEKDDDFKINQQQPVPATEEDTTMNQELRRRRMRK